MRDGRYYTGNEIEYARTHVQQNAPFLFLIIVIGSVAWILPQSVVVMPLLILC